MINNENSNNIFANGVVLDHFNKNIRDKFKIVDDYYKALKVFYEKYPMTYGVESALARYPIGHEFFELFSLTPLQSREISYALNTIYASIGIEEVIYQIANFSGIKIKVNDADIRNKTLTITILSESIFDLDLFEQKFTDFLADLLLFQSLEYIFDLIVTTINLEYNKKIYNITEIQNIIPLTITQVIKA